MPRRLLVTGANGFVGRHVLAEARARGWASVGLVRSGAGARVVEEAGGRPVMGGLDADALRHAMDGADAVVHLAHIGAERDDATYASVNVAGTRAVAEAAWAAGVRRVAMFSGLGVAHYGQARRTTNPYFLSKLAAEVELFRSGVAAVVFRPSYIVGPGDALVRARARDLGRGVVEMPGDGSYRMQPIAVADAASAVLVAVESEGRGHQVFDLVGPEPVTYRRFVEEVARAMAEPGRRPRPFAIREVPVEEADRQAAAGGYQGMTPDELDCLLCDETADARPLAALLGRPLRPLAEALGAALSRDRLPQ